MDKWNGPCRRNSKHDYECDEVCGVNQKPPVFGICENGHYDPVKKYQMRRALGQQTKSEKNARRNPHEPWRLLLHEKAQPENNRQPAKRDIKRFNLNQPAFFYNTAVG